MEDKLMDLLKAEALRRGYRFEETETEVKMFRPDGTLAMKASKRQEELKESR